MSVSSTAVPNDNLIIIIAGPTGSGKSDVAAQYCRKDKNGIVVSADSVQAYRGVQIGANKPTPAELKRTPHLLLNMASHDQTYNAAEWRRDALYCIQQLLQIPQKLEQQETIDSPKELLARRREMIDKVISESREKEDAKIVPIIVGGTMMYIQWLLHGCPDAMRPSQDAVTKAQNCISNYQASNDWDGAVQHVESMGPTFSSRIETLSGQDWYRLRRILEVAYTVADAKTDPNTSTSSRRKRSLEESLLYSGQREGALKDVFPSCSVRCFFLCPTDRMHHSMLLDQRCEDMILGGLLEETTELFCRDELPEMASRAIGYRQTLDYLLSDWNQGDETQALELYLENFCTATRRYAKKQMQWFRKEQDFLFVPIDTSGETSVGVETAATLIQNMCQMPQDQYEKVLRSNDNEFAKTRQANQDQGKGMKFYQYKSTRIVQGTAEFDDILKRSNVCAGQIKAKEETRKEPATRSEGT